MEDFQEVLNSSTDEIISTYRKGSTIRMVTRGRFCWSALISCCVVLSPLFANRHAVADELARGVVLPAIVCKGNEGHSYALYLPQSYSPSREWPIIYGFDPGGRGQVAVEVFRAAAEKYGYIVVGSNNSRNGAGVPLDAIVKSLMDDTHARLSIDDR